MTIEHLAWSSYLSEFTDTILDQVGISMLTDPQSQMAAEATACADALMRERQKRFPRPDFVRQVLETNH